MFAACELPEVLADYALISCQQHQLSTQFTYARCMNPPAQAQGLGMQGIIH
jgi:hypothetical protein